ncbi:UNVERIFIED_CONTAM: Laccase-11 [Sesamum latifolium]|uniref:laccase n=1 Tax=Sesamum latifolium TaxID=2727402 RepID=A0AAW2V0J3_9LAMI
MFHWTIRLFLVCLVGYVSTPATAAVKKYQFDIQVKNVSRLCHEKPIVTYNMSIHWHRMKQYRNGWADGPAYVTQCPVQTGQSYTYDFNVTGQRGTLWWHAHISWLRATVCGAIVIMPKQGTSYPFPQPDFEFNLLLGEWWNDDVETVIKQGNKLGLPPKTSDAHTINGKPGPLFPCSEKHTYAVEVEQGKTYLLRIINAALNDELFFAVAGHNMTVVEIDAVYTKPFSTNAVLIAPGQTTNVLLRANQAPGRYFMAARPFMDAPISVDNKTATAILRYKGIQSKTLSFQAFLSYQHSMTYYKTPTFYPLSLTPSISTGYNFFVVGSGIGNFDPKNDPAKFNLVDPPERNTVGVPTGGWTAIRFRADNPGVWFMHCHLEVHTGWRLKTAFVVEDGPDADHSVLPPPKDLPPC